MPTVTGALLDRPITLLPIPFVDYTQDTAAVLPAVAVAISMDLGQVLFGMVLPFWAMVGTGIGLLTTMILNPVLYGGLPDFLPVASGAGAGVLSSWNPGDNMQQTVYKNNVDFYFSFSLGVALTIAVAGFVSVFKQVAKARKRAAEDRAAGYEPEVTELPEGRGDIRPWAVIATYVISTALYLGVSCWLLILTDGRIHPPLIAVMLFYAIIYTPILSYVTARLEGIAGEVINLPFVREGSFILSGYQGVAVWFLPIPIHNYGSMTVFYRQCELTGTKFTSIWKSELLLTPIILVGSLCFAHFIWGLGPIPGPQYPFAQAWWEVTAENLSLVFSSTLGGFCGVRAGLPRRLHPRGLSLRRRALRRALLGRRTDLPHLRHRPRLEPDAALRGVLPAARGLHRAVLLPQEARPPLAAVRPGAGGRLLLRHGPHRHAGRGRHILGEGRLQGSVLRNRSRATESAQSRVRGAARGSPPSAV